MNFASPPLSARPPISTDALFRAHWRASVGMAVYLIGGSALLMAMLGSLHWAQTAEMDSAWPAAVAVLLLLWLAVGAWGLQRQHRQVQARTRSYESAFQRETQARAMPTQPAPLAAILHAPDATAPFELHGFWGAPRPAAAGVQRCLPEQRSIGPAAPLRPARPVSLFGAFQASMDA